MPLIPGSCTSNTRQSALRGWAEFKNSSAEANTSTSKPADLISLSSDLRIEISSSTTEIIGIGPWIPATGEKSYYTLVVDLRDRTEAPSDVLDATFEQTSYLGG